MSETIAERLEAYGCIVRAVGETAKDAYVFCQSYEADAIVMAAELPDSDCITVTTALEREITHPLLKIVISDAENSTLAEHFFNYGGDLFLSSPIDYGHCIDEMWRYYRLRQRQGTPLGPTPLVRGCARKHLMRMRMPSHVHGLVYLLDAIELVHRDPAILKTLVYGLYTDVGTLHQEPYENIERCIRSAVEKTFERGNVNYIYQHFGEKVGVQSGKTTNGDFIEILFTMVQNDLKD